MISLPVVYSRIRLMIKMIRMTKKIKHTSLVAHSWPQQFPWTVAWVVEGSI